VFHISIWGGLGALFGGAKPTKAPPWRRDWPEQWAKNTVKRTCQYG